MALRLVVLLFAFAANVETVDAIMALSEPVVVLIKLVPPANRTILGSATLADLTVGIVLFVIPLPFIGRRRPMPR